MFEQSDRDRGQVNNMELIKENMFEDKDSLEGKEEIIKKTLGLKDDVNTDIASCTSASANSVTDGLIKLFQSVADSPVQSFGDKFSNFLTFPQ